MAKGELKRFILGYESFEVKRVLKVSLMGGVVPSYQVCLDKTGSI